MVVVKEVILKRIRIGKPPSVYKNSNNEVTQVGDEYHFPFVFLYGKMQYKIQINK
jgi:hypothetical protein